MSRELEKLRRSVAPRTNEDVEPFPLRSLNEPGGMFVFRYSRTEISSQGGQIHVKKNETRYANGKFTSEECEGTLDRAAYDGIVRQTQDYFLNRVANFIKLFY